MTVRAVEGKKPYTGGKGIEIDENKVISLRLRDENNLIIWDEGDNEIYVDLQLDDEIRPTDAFPVGITTGRVIIDNGWDKTGTLICAKTTSGDNIKIFYSDDGHLYVDNGTGLFTQVYLKPEVDALLSDLRTYVDTELAKKQDKLIAGQNITIDQNNEISAIDTTYDAGEGILLGTVHPDIQGPAPDGFHVPLNTEWQAVYDVWTALGGGSSDGTNFGIALKLPFAGNRSRSSAGVFNQGTNGRYWSSSRYNANNAYYLHFNPSTLNPQNNDYSTIGSSVRCFKDTPIIPTSSWTTLYQGTGNAGIFWSSADGLISMSSDGQTWITIADKNLGATTVWNDGDTLSEANCGKYYQWGNNYGFPFTGDVTTSSTRVDASNYGPGNYYNSSTFIIRATDWSSVSNDNLWGGVTKGTWISNDGNTIINTGVLSVNGQTGNVTINYTAGSCINIDANNEISVDYSWTTITISSGNATLTDTRCKLIPTGNFTLQAPSTVSEGQEYVLRCDNTTAYTMTLGTGFTNPHNVDLTLSANATDQFVFLATPSGDLELQPTQGGTYSAGTGISISNNTITNTLPGVVVSSTAPSNPTQGTYRYDTTNNLLLYHDGSSWKYANNVKTFRLSSLSDSTTLQAISNWIINGTVQNCIAVVNYNMGEYYLNSWISTIERVGTTTYIVYHFYFRSVQNFATTSGGDTVIYQKQLDVYYKTYPSDTYTCTATDETITTISGGITNDKTGTTTTVAKIWAGTSAELALITKDTDTLYISF